MECSSSLTFRCHNLACHFTCQTCTGGNETDCETCQSGYKKEVDSEDENNVRCVDINECVEQDDVCPSGQYCVNNESSYTCTGKYISFSIGQWWDSVGSHRFYGTVSRNIIRSANRPVWLLILCIS